jgi:hypothetical protein
MFAVPSCPERNDTFSTLPLSVALSRAGLEFVTL